MEKIIGNFLSDFPLLLDVLLSSFRSLLGFSLASLKLWRSGSNCTQSIKFYHAFMLLLKEDFLSNSALLINVPLQHVSFATRIFLELHLKSKLFFLRERIFSLKVFPILQACPFALRNGRLAF